MGLGMWLGATAPALHVGGGSRLHPRHREKEQTKAKRVGAVSYGRDTVNAIPSGSATRLTWQGDLLQAGGPEFESQDQQERRQELTRIPSPPVLRSK